MSDKKTAQDWYEAYKQALQQLQQEKPEIYKDRHIAATWEELSEQQRALFENMALKSNAIYGPFVL